MRLILYGTTALSLLMTIDNFKSLPALGKSALRDCLPTEESLTHLLKTYPQIKPPAHCLTDTWVPQIESLGVAHSSTFDYPKGSFVQIGHGIFVPRPELCLIQLASQISQPELALYGSALASSFALDPSSRNGLKEREPLTDRRSLARYLNSATGARGSKTVRTLLPYFLENAASPPEIFLGLMLCLPTRLGGFHLPMPQLNTWITLRARGRILMKSKHLKPDLCWPDHRVAVEYDSNSEHLNARQATRDSTRRLALEASGFKTLSVTTQQLAYRDRADHIAHEVARALGIRLRVRHPQFLQRRNELFLRKWSLDPLFSPTWLAQRSGNNDAALALPEYSDW